MANVYVADHGRRFTLVLNGEEGKALKDIVNDIVRLHKEFDEPYYTDDVYQLALELGDKLK